MNYLHSSTCCLTQFRAFSSGKRVITYHNNVTTSEKDVPNGGYFKKSILDAYDFKRVYSMYTATEFKLQN